MNENNSFGEKGDFGLSENQKYNFLTGLFAFFIVFTLNILLYFIINLVTDLLSGDTIQSEIENENNIIGNKVLLFSTMFLTNLIIFLVIFVIGKLRKIDLKEMLRLKHPSSYISYIIAVLGIIGVNFVLSIIWTLISSVADLQFIKDYENLANASFGTTNLIELIFMIVFVGIAAGIFEEVLFRGFILNSFRKNMSPVVAIILSSLLFGIMHLNLVQGISGFILGMYLGFLAYKTDSLYPAIVAHIANNVFSLLISNLVTLPTT